jgi:hypothetical protein
VRQSFFHWSFAPLVQLGGGVTGCRGYHISFRPTQRGLSLNMGKCSICNYLLVFLWCQCSVNLAFTFDQICKYQVI